MQTKEEIYKQKFKELFFDQIGYISLRINFDNSYIKYYYAKDKYYLGHYDSKIKYFYLNYYTIWSFFESEFGFNYQKIKELSKNILEKSYNLKDIKT